LEMLQAGNAIRAAIGYNSLALIVKWIAKNPGLLVKGFGVFYALRFRYASKSLRKTPVHLADNLMVLISPALTKRQKVDIEKSASLQTVLGRNTSVLLDMCVLVLRVLNWL